MKLKYILFVVLVTLLTVAGVSYFSNLQRTKELQEYVEKNSLTLVGSFNEWDVEDDSYKMESLGDYKYRYELDTKQLETEFKIVNFNSWEYEFNSYIVVNRDAEYLNLSAGNINIKTPGKYEVLLDLKANAININQLEKYSMVTFTCYYTENFCETFTVIEGTTWIEFLTAFESTNLNYDINNNLISYCAIDKIASVYDDDVTLDDVIVSTTYGNKSSVTLTSTYGSKEYSIIKGMTWNELIEFNELQNDAFLYLGEGQYGECVCFKDRFLSTESGNDRIILESY